jgi:hypothetical protein
LEVALKRQNLCRREDLYLRACTRNVAWKGALLGRLLLARPQGDGVNLKLEDRGYAGLWTSQNYYSTHFGE